MSTPKDATTMLMELTEAKGVTAALLAGVTGKYALQLDNVQALSFGAAAALATSVGDLALTYSGFATKIETYLSSQGAGNYIDVNDFVAGAVGGALIGYGMGYSGQELGMVVAITATAAGFAPMVLSKVMLQLAPIPVTK